MSFLKNYSKISRISYRTYRTFVTSNKGTPGSFSSGDNNSQSSSNQPKTKSFSSEFATSNTSTSSSTSGNEFPPTGTSKYDNIYNKPAENLTSPHNTSTPFDRTSSNTQENISGTGRSETSNIPRGQSGSERSRPRETNTDYASRRDRDSASSTLQDLANTAANLAGSAVKGVADVVASGLGNQSNQRLRTPYDDPRYSDIYNDRHQDRYDDRNANNAANIVGTVVKGIADTASNVASNFIPGSRGSQDNRNRGIAETVVETAVKSAVNAAGSVVSSFIPGNQNRPNRDYDDYRDRERDRYRPNDNSPISSAIQGLAGAAKTVANVAGTVASNLGSAAHDSRLREPYEDDRYRNRNRDRYNNDRYDDRRYERYNDRNADRERYDERYSHRDQTSETVHNVADQINQGAQAFAKNTREAASRVSNSAGDFASTASNIASGVIGAAGSAALHAATTVAQTFNTTTSNRRSFNRARRTEGRGLEQGGPSVPAGSKSNYEIIISGGGVNGGALACALGHSQFFDGQNKKILVLDPFEAQPIDKFHTKNEVPDQRVVSLSLGSVNFLKELGVWDLVNQERLGTINQMQVWEVGGNSFIKFNEDPSKVIGYVIENNHLQAAIYERMRNLGNIELVASKVVDVRSEPNSFATVVLNNEDVLAARLVVGSDGTNSLVRNKARIPTTGWSSHQTGIVCTVKTQDHNTTAWQRFMSTGPLAVLPLWDEYSSIVWSCETSFHQSLMQLNDEDFLKELNYALNRKPYVDTPNIVLSSRAAFELPPIVTGICNKRRTFPLGMQQADQFVAERVALIGDAAHNVHPLAGQGLNLGLTDAAYLANVIVKNLKTGNDYGRQDLLIEYETLSQNINKSMMYGLEFIKRSYETNQYDPIVFARNLATGFINNLSPMKGLFTDVANGKFFQPSEYEWKKNN